MATILHRDHQPWERTVPQKAAIGIGLAFSFLGVAGMIFPGLAGLHLSMAHNLFHLVSGVVALLCGYGGSKTALKFCVVFGIIYLLLGAAGFIIGTPGYPSVGNAQADQYLFLLVPNVFELGSMDHFVHLIMAAFLLFTAYTFRKDVGRNL